MNMSNQLALFKCFVITSVTILLVHFPLSSLASYIGMTDGYICEQVLRAGPHDPSIYGAEASGQTVQFWLKMWL